MTEPFLVVLILSCMVPMFVARVVWYPTANNPPTAEATAVSLLSFQRSSLPVPSTVANRAGCMGDLIYRT